MLVRCTGLGPGRSQYQRSNAAGQAEVGLAGLAAQGWNVARTENQKLGHDLEKCEAVFREDHADKKLKRDDDSP
jgi:hypothetical protein